MATPPCQGMSTAGKQDKFDARNNLFLYAIQLIKDIYAMVSKEHFRDIRAY